MRYEVGILAAGQSRRFGSPKQLAYFSNQTLLERALEVASAISAAPWLVLGAHESQIRARCVLESTRVVVAEDWRDGMAAALRALVKSVRQTAQVEGLVVMLVDQPLLEPKDLQALVAKAAKFPGRPVICRDDEGKLGPPAFFPANWFDALSRLEGDQGARSLLRQEGCEVVDIGQRGRDVDTRADLARLGAEIR